MADLHALLDQAEQALAEDVAHLLDEVADEFTRALQGTDEIVAARFRVSRIARMWAQRVPRIVRRLLGIVETAATRTADDIDAPLPDGWDDLPGRHQDGRDLPPQLGDYVTTTEHLLRAVGQRLADTAVAELAAGLDAGEDIEQLRARLRAVFARTGAQLGDVREERIARTEAARAWNTAALAAAQALTGPDRPLAKQWVTRHDTHVRHAHAEVDGQLRLLDEPFTVAGVSMSAPGDPTAPPELVINCRCVMAVARADRTAAYESQGRSLAAFSNPREAGMDGATGPAVTAAGGHTGAMIALMPREEDARRLALTAPGAEPADQLHLTLFYLGEGTDWDAEHRADLTARIRARAEDLAPTPARAFGAAHWNANGDEPCWVWSIGDDRDAPGPSLDAARNAAVAALEDMHRQPGLPAQHSPWQPHVCAAYSPSPTLLGDLEDRLGAIVFDRIRLAFAGDYTDIPLDPEEAPTMDEPDDQTDAVTAAGMPARPWSTPDGTAIAFENQETGDGRVFAPGSLYWEGGPWPLQYADEMLMGHEGAELAGAIQTIGRDGDRITASGVIYPGRPAGADAVTLLEEGAPLGVSVDLDDVDVEFVDRTMTDENGGGLVLAASLATVGLLRLDDGSWVFTANTAAEWTAAGTALSRTRHDVQFITGPGGSISADAVRAAFANTGALTAAAGDPDQPDTGTVVHAESSGDLLLRITRARIRGATLVAMPAYDRARIVLDDVNGDQEQRAASAVASAEVAAITAAGPGETHWRVVGYVNASPVPVGAREVAQALGIAMEAARGHLARAADAGRIVRLARGQYVGASSLPEGVEVSAALSASFARLDDEVQAIGERLSASLWHELQDTDPMPAEWFKEPTPEELPRDAGGVFVEGGRIWGWVAQAGVEHAGYPGKRLTIESLGDLDTSHFLRARFRLDDGTTVRAGAFTMNVGHHRDGAECETAACQFDDTRTVAGIVTIGQNENGMWFAGAANPKLDAWDKAVFRACQPSYHMRMGPDGRWQVRGLLDVPQPGHSSPLLATAITEHVTLAASESGAPTSVDTMPGHAGQPADTSGQPVSGQVADTSGQPVSASALDASALAAALADPVVLDGLAAALERRETARAEAARAEVQRLAAAVAPARDVITASAHPGATREGAV
ncbi:phage minor head protein [Streptomyces sp. SRF1]|uniref:phage minor head protein n=1 Tax=Streptomyces sp. SRF1 TaxID=1549642 RepID=UPI0025B13B32|nr:phage minor head protein [Streptomyces sp. SRF1]MDN3056855.1 phage minor head protein [Streptomyces sp. SRF1]